MWCPLRGVTSVPAPPLRVFEQLARFDRSAYVLVRVPRSGQLPGSGYEATVKLCTHKECENGQGEPSYYN